VEEGSSAFCECVCTTWTALATRGRRIKPKKRDRDFGEVENLRQAMSTCKLCLEDKQLIAAHIIPESLYAPLRKDSKIPRMYSTEEGSFPKRSPTGIYDSGILYADCDNRIGDWDNYAQAVLLTPLDRYGEPADLSRQEVFVISDLDYDQFKLFFVSLLWRADQSSHPFFQGVDLGPWRERAREMILNADPGEPDEFGVFLVRYEHPLAVGTIYHPERTRPEGINCYRFSLGSYVAMLKVDKRPFDASLDSYLLRPRKELLVALFEYKESRIYADIAERIKAGAFRFKKRAVRSQNPVPPAGSHGRR